MELVDIDKRVLLNQVEAKLKADLDAVLDSQRIAQEGATQSESKQEGSKDMRSTESSYIARGLAKRVAEIQESLQRLGQVAIKKTSTIQVTSLVKINDGQSEQIYFVLPVGGGISVSEAGQTIRVITHQAPLGRVLLGLSEGDDALFERPSGTSELELIEIA